MAGANTQTTGSSGLTPEMKEYYERVLLERLKDTLVFVKYGQKKKLPKNSGKTISFRRFDNLPVATTPLTEGVTPDGNSLKVTEIKCTVAQYGDYVTISDVLNLTAIDPILDETADMQGDQAALTVDTIVRDVLVGGTNVLYAGGKTARDTITPADKLTSLEIRKAVRAMKRNKVRPVEGGYYLCLLDADAEFDLQDDENWKFVSQYQAAEKIYSGEIGKLYGVKFVSNTNSKVFSKAGAESADVHCSIVLGSNAFGVVDIEGSSSPEFIVKTDGGTNDPLNQRQTAGWKCMFATIILQQLAVLRIEHGATA